MIQLDIQMLEEKRLAEGLPKYRMARVAGSGRQGFYFDLLRHDGWMRDWRYATRLIQWYGDRGCILKTSGRRKI